MPLRAVVAFGDSARREAAVRALADEELRATGVSGEEEFLAAVEGDAADVVLIDATFPGVWVADYLREIADLPRRPGVIVVGASGDQPLRESALALGAAAYLAEPLDWKTLARRVHEAHDWARAAPPPGLHGLRPGEDLRELLGASLAIVPVLTQLIRVCNHDVTVLLTGERGTGKGVLARLLHERGPRRAGSFVEVNCATLGPTLLESELFGHEKGAFTDARTDKRGLFEVADGGTLFLDEIGDMPLEVQPKLLTAIETKRFRRLGGVDLRRADVRLVASTNHDLQKAVAEGRFRGDLYDRLNVVRIQLPGLRERGTDICTLAKRFTAEFAEKYGEPVQGLTAEAEALLLAYPFPGNVRELRNVIERAVLLCQGTRIRPDDLPGRIAGATRPIGRDTGAFPTLEEAERGLVDQVLRHTGGNRHRAARILNISRSTLLGKIRRYGLA